MKFLRIIPKTIPILFSLIISQLPAQTLILKPSKNNLYILSDSTSADTLHDQFEYNVVFRLGGQDVLAAWFVCPADLTIKACGYDCGENTDSSVAELKIVKIKWTLDSLTAENSRQIGYLIDSNNNIEPFLKNGDESNEWISVNNLSYPFGEEIWSDSGLGAPTIPEDDFDRETYQWVEMNAMNEEPQLKEGDLFAVCIKNTSPPDTENYIGIYSAEQQGYGSMKFYANGRDPEDSTSRGWWQREYTPNLAVAVELSGDYSPSISDVDQLETALTDGDRKITAIITDNNPGGGPAGIDSAFIQYFINSDTTWKSVIMVNTGNDIFEGVLPGQRSGTKITYRIRAVDVIGNVTISENSYSYYVFIPGTEVKNLLVLNGFPEYYVNDYFNVLSIPDTEHVWTHDTWRYGALSSRLVNNYETLFEITNSSDAGVQVIYNDKIIKEWLGADPKRNYALAGQEWLGARYGFIDMDFVPGSFEYDVLGVSHSYNDVADTSDSLLPSRLFTEHSSLICGDLNSEFEKLNMDSLRYDPHYELGTGNWIDGFDVIPGQETDLTVETRFIQNEPKKDTLTCVTHRTTEAGNKIAFLSLDPLAINTSPYSSKYINFGRSTSAPQLKIIQWFDEVTHTQSGLNKITSYSLSRNYPNPFNAQTTINFSLAEDGLVDLTLFNVLGEQITVLINEFKKSGTYSLKFNAGELASGIYYYCLKSGSFSAVNKMALIK